MSQDDYASPIPFGTRVKLAREGRQLTQAQLAEAVSVNQGHISKIESGRAGEVGAKLLISLSLALGVNGQILLSGTDGDFLLELENAMGDEATHAPRAKSKLRALRDLLSERRAPVGAQALPGYGMIAAAGVRPSDDEVVEAPAPIAPAPGEHPCQVIVFTGRYDEGMHAAIEVGAMIAREGRQVGTRVLLLDGDFEDGRMSLTLTARAVQVDPLLPPLDAVGLVEWHRNGRPAYMEGAEEAQMAPVDLASFTAWRDDRSNLHIMASPASRSDGGWDPFRDDPQGKVPYGVYPTELLDILREHYDVILVSIGLPRLAERIYGYDAYVQWLSLADQVVVASDASVPAMHVTPQIIARITRPRPDESGQPTAPLVEPGRVQGVMSGHPSTGFNVEQVVGQAFPNVGCVPLLVSSEQRDKARNRGVFLSDRNEEYAAGVRELATRIITV